MSQNLYSYVGNNPVNYVDPTGHMQEGINDDYLNVNTYDEAKANYDQAVYQYERYLTYKKDAEIDYAYATAKKTQAGWGVAWSIVSAVASNWEAVVLTGTIVATVVTGGAAAPLIPAATAAVVADGGAGFVDSVNDIENSLSTRADAKEEKEECQENYDNIEDWYNSEIDYWYNAMIYYRELMVELEP